MKKNDQWRIYDIHSHKSRHYNIKTKKSFWRASSRLGGLAKGGLTVLISVLAIYGIIQAGSLTPSASPAATSYTLSDIYARLTTNGTSTEADHIFSPSASPTGTLYTLIQIYNSIPTIIANTVKLGTSYLGVAGTLVPDGGTATTTDVLSGKTFFGDSQTDWTFAVGTMADNGAFSLTASSTDQSVTAGYYSGGTLAGDADLATGNIKKDIGIFGITGLLFGDTDASKVLTTADGGGAAKGTYNATNLSVNNVRYGTAFGVDSTGTLSPYPNTPSGISGLNQTVCTDAGWTWVADSNYDTVNDDPICVNPNREAATKVWNTSVENDNTFIGNYGCSGDTDGDGVGTLNATLSGTVSENTGYGDDAAVALAIADCKDGIRNLLTKAAVESAGYTAPDTDCTPTTNDCYNGPLTPKALVEWKGTRLPSHNDFFGVCGDGTNSTTYGNYGNQIGRTDNVITTNAGSWEWLSELHGSGSARVAGNSACSYFLNGNVTSSNGLRVVFRP